jgi:hypothetical protein
MRICVSRTVRSVKRPSGICAANQDGNGLPRLHHPVFSAPGFERATTDGFFLCVMSTDPIFDPLLVRSFFVHNTDVFHVTELYE